MKKFTLILTILLSTIGSVSAQLFETFDNLSLTDYPLSNGYVAHFGDIPSSWTEHDVDQQLLYYIQDERMDGKGFRARIIDVYGVKDTVATASSTFDQPTGTADDWLITPQFTIPNLTGSQESILFWEHKTYQGDQLSYEVLVSTTGNSPSDFSTVLWTAPSGLYSQAGFEFNNLDLSAYEGQQIHLAFHYIASVSGWGSNLFLDDFELKTIEGFDVDLQSVNTYRYQKWSESQMIKCNLFNWGQDITELDIVWNDGANSNSMTLTGVTIPQFSFYSFEHSIPFSQNGVGEYPITVSLENINGTGQVDSDLSNNSKQTLVSVVQDGPERKVVLEKLTGTWCPWCPRGIVTLDSISQLITDGTFIPIAVHCQTNDPMTVQEYSDEVNLGGAPTCKLDRHKDFDSLTIAPWITYDDVLAKKVRVTPAEVNQTLAYDSITGDLTINCSATFHTDISTELRFAAIVVEDSLSGTHSDWAQANAYSGSSTPMGPFNNLPSPVPASQMVYNHVGRALIGGHYGQPNSISGTISTGDTKTHTFTYPVPDTFKIKDLHIVTVVLDNETGEILNAISSGIPSESTASVNEIHSSNFSIQLYPSLLTTENLNVIIESKTNEVYYFNMYSATGELLIEENLGMIHGKTKMNIPIKESIASGAYYVTVGTNSRTEVEKIIIKR